MMALRITKSHVTFDEPFKIKGRDEILSAGSYEVETDEEIIEGNESTVYRRVATRLYIRSTGMTRAITVDPKELETASCTELAATDKTGIQSEPPKGVAYTKVSQDEAYHLNRQPHERMLATETTDPRVRAAHLRLAKMHGKMARGARGRAGGLKPEGR
jgi:hypothetical protein